MSFKSILQDMKGEFGSISRKGFEGRFGRSRSHRVVEESVVTAVDAMRQSCWANMPPELLRDVLMRIEESDCDWPSRQNVVACSGVCRSWREIMKDIVRNLEVSGKVTFPISVKQPGPRNTLVQCFIKRNRSSQTYHLYLNYSQASNDNGKFLLAARRCRRPTYTDYIISLNAGDVSKTSSNNIGKLRSNFLGTKFTIFDAQPPNAGAKVTKSRSTRGPRRMQCVMDAIPVAAIEPGGIAPTQTAFIPGNFDSFPSLPFFRSKSTRSDSFQSGPISTPKDEMLVLKNKTPRWHDQLQCWCLNFNGRVTVASVKNFQLVASLENGAGGQEQQHENVILQFGKVGKDIFTMDYQYPISAFQAFAICLSSFDTKIACE
ncbi:hypothetical protein SASPL_120961 [Salvia splendens]|uniref:Tubby-like F-box protein n=1 Tax=Salvia splendens TaxID=180675 RepID=A0A8X8XWF8_SALSN|nr:tubby-like F-box protein 3 isoform X2 [Salvia splendens]KAG6418756.1 hypothetical protein SASPL_120961 [Salvia splendens]